MPKNKRELPRQEEALTATVEKNHKELAVRVGQLTTAVRVATASDATSAIAKVTPVKGDTYACSIHRVVQQIAVGSATNTATPARSLV